MTESMSMLDEHTSVAQLRTIVKEFVDARDWNQFHAPKNLSMSLAIEAAELMEHFQWLTTDESCEVVNDPKKLMEIGEELADVLCYGLALANQLNIDVSQVLTNKMEKNKMKYPADEFHGRYRRD